MLLLRDLTELYITAQQAEIDWVILLQTASAVRDAGLRDTVVSCREDAEKVGKWLRTRIKQTAPQVLAAG